MADRTLAVDCCVVGGGPAGMMLGFLLARAGVKVVVLEKHADFLRDFRGDTIHPSTLRVMDELGLLDALLALPHQKARTLKGQVGDFVVGCDGRHSTVRDKAGFTIEDLGAPMDVLWFALSRGPGDPEEMIGRFDAGRIFIMINRGTHWQCGLVIPKGSLAKVQAEGLEEFRADLSRLAPFIGDRGSEIATWDNVKLLTVSVDRLTDWACPGLLCIGDAAHTMSPVGGVGINLAVQDAVATANILAERLRAGSVTIEDLRQVQRRRAFPARMTQAAQVFIQRRVITRILGGSEPISPPLIMKLLGWFPILRRIPARLVGIGIRPEHIRTAEAAGR